MEEKLPTVYYGACTVIRTLESFVCREGRKGEKPARLWRRHPAQKIPVSLTVSSDLCIPRLQSMQCTAQPRVVGRCVSRDIINEWYSFSTLDSPNPDVEALTISMAAMS